MIPYLREAFKNIIRKPVTIKFPSEPVKVAPKYRGKIEFNKDVCIGCGMCTRVCSPGAITKTQKKVENSDDTEITLEFDLSSCTFCGFCSDFCPKHAITLTEDCIIVTDDKSKLKVGGSFIKKAPVKPKLTPEQLAKIAAAKKKL